ncbi:hypothetical protein [Agromyces sp. CCNWLW203]|uniref:hypothetical protein n=1 Tax=Agromyces sp. CCNWLW203 TaxID=3112842 RepID=UPI002F9666F2
MEQRSTDGYIFLGTAVRYLMDMKPGFTVYGDAHVLFNINSLEHMLDAYEFYVTSRVGYALFKVRDELAKDLADHEGDDEWIGQRGLTDNETTRIVNAAGILRETLLAESKGKVAFIASDKRYTVAKLITDVGSLMGPGVYESMPDLARYDFEEGGKALAYDLPTAAGFHILRGTEAVLRDFYCRVVRRDRINEPRMWAAMISHMRGKRNAPANLLLDNLDSLRSNFRNPTQHPEKTYDQDEVQDLLALAIDSINRMVRHLADRSL